MRVDPLTGLKAIIADGRGDRSGAGLREPEPSGAIAADEDDPFLEGNEAQTPAEIDAVRAAGSPPDGAGWQVRVFANKFPALVADAPRPEREARLDLFASSAAAGAHEVIVNTPRPAGSLGDLPQEQLALAMTMWRQRMNHHMAVGAACVHLFVNDGARAGASQPHSHAQLVALGFVPALIARERERFGAHATRTMGGNLLGDLVQEEVRLDQRVVAVHDDTVTLAPWASASAYQLLIAPRRPAMHWEDDGPLGAEAVGDALARLRRHLGTLPALNVWVRTAPRDAEHFCWRIDIRPRIETAAGLELGTGVELNAVSPERAAHELRRV